MDGNMNNFFRHENQVCPPAMYDVGSLCLGTKGYLLMSFEEITDAKLRKPTTTSIVLEGAAISRC
jgi:hypothetical protein